MADPRIAVLKAREILDSKARPMVEVDVWSDSGVPGRGASPCGTSVGQHEAHVLRDGGTRYGGLGVRRAVQNVVEVIFPAIRHMSVMNQQTIDARLVELDGTPNKSRLGANAVYSVSIAVARAAATAAGVSLYRQLSPEANRLPVPMFNMINGGTFGTVQMPIQEFLLIPATADRYSEALRMGVEAYSALPGVIRQRYGKDRVRVGSSAGYGAPPEIPVTCWRYCSKRPMLPDPAGCFGWGWTAPPAIFMTRRQAGIGSAVRWWVVTI